MLLKADGAAVSDTQLISSLNLFLHPSYGTIFKTSLMATADVCEVFSIFFFFSY